MSGQTARAFVRTITKDGVINLNDSIILVDTTDGDVALVLPPILRLWKGVFNVMKVTADANIVTIETPDSALINGKAFYEILSQYEQIEVQNAGSQWLAVFENAAQLGWKDLTTNPIVKGVAGANTPPWTQMGTSAFSAYRFDIDDEIWFNFHMPHDWSPGTPMHIHAHWTPNGTNVQPVKWQFDITQAKGFNQASGGVFDIVGGGEVLTIEEVGPGVAWRHVTSEVVASMTITDYEPDGIVILRAKRVTNGAVDNADIIFMLTCDIHYQADRLTTPNKAPNFYGT